LKKNDTNPWYLAKPVGRKRLEVQSKVLCLVPAPSSTNVAIKEKTLSSDDDGDETTIFDLDANVEEYCFTGTVIAIADGHGLIHFDGQSKADDVWMTLSSPKLFLNGGTWNEHNMEASNGTVTNVDVKQELNQGKSSNTLPILHYWKEMDSNALP
jgi:hypothetical protein